MKKNVVSIIILALSVANLVLSALLVFTFVPQAKKTDKLVTEICSVLKLELDSSGVKDKVEPCDRSTLRHTDLVCLRVHFCF